MNVLEKKHIYPIIIPIKMFVDRFNQHNAFYDMNPSMHIDKTGNVKILVRSVNYRKFYNKQFTMYENYSNSLYTLLTGKIESDKLLNLDELHIENITYNYFMPTYPTYWKGLEDIRFVNSKSLLVTIPECNENGNPSIFRASLDENYIHSFTECKPNIIEKNWMPYEDINGNEMVVYSLNPFKIKEIEKDIFTEISFSENLLTKLKNYHGSTNGIKYDEYEEVILFLIHRNDIKTCHRWLLFNSRTNEILLSEEFCFFRHSYIEFPVSLAFLNERIFISLGVNDDKAFIVETTKAVINDVFFKEH